MTLKGADCIKDWETVRGGSQRTEPVDKAQSNRESIWAVDDRSCTVLVEKESRPTIPFAREGR